MHTLVTSRRERNTTHQSLLALPLLLLLLLLLQLANWQLAILKLALFVSFFTTLYDDACLPPEAKNSLHTQGRQFSALNSAMEQLRLVDKRA
ncbi:hypothetical protein T4E_12189 [Trichinella pseudospiralis]|uniref:Uncharacterized protein n=1 Tax=Trichinella pseudospiralis TaxID=6337 RepID=A0A0V0Y9H0_TRIPS|nr:hypothetical protein T4E_12189 [Trichinella pseudospiralis]